MCLVYAAIPAVHLARRAGEVHVHEYTGLVGHNYPFCNWLLILVAASLRAA